MPLYDCAQPRWFTPIGRLRSSILALASLDESQESRALSISVYRQDFERMADKPYQCLVHQNRPGWVASTYRIKGELVPRI